MGEEETEQLAKLDAAIVAAETELKKHQKGAAGLQAKSDIITM